MEGNGVTLHPGDLVIYRGCDLSHWREPFDIADQTAWHVQGFFHYVDKNGPFPEYQFDKRESIGSPKTLSLKKQYIKYV
jgi:hypothetical protein